MSIVMISDLLIVHFRLRCLRPSGSQMDMRAISLSYSWQKSSIIQKISVILSLVISITIVSFYFITNWFTTIKVLKIIEITNFYKDFLIPNSGYKLKILRKTQLFACFANILRVLYFFLNLLSYFCMRIHLFYNNVWQRKM